MINYIIPSLVLGIIVYGVLHDIDIYDVFIEGVKEGLQMILKIFPTIFAFVIAIDIFIKSNIIKDLTKIIAPFFSFFHFPQELFPLALMRPISGSSSLVILNDILKTNGSDSYVGRIASVLQGSTDTTIYILSLYFSSIGIKKIKYSLFVGLFADFCAVVLSILVIQLLF